jgi:MFS family permease
MTSRLRASLAGMMFLEYAVWGAWMPILGATLINRGVSPQDVGNTYAAVWLACVISPFLGGQLVDRSMPSQVFLAISHGLAAIAAWVLAGQASSQSIIAGMFVWALLFAPSLGITNSVAFHHIGLAVSNEAAREKEFSRIRTAGTLG